jgi:transposase
MINLFVLFYPMSNHISLTKKGEIIALFKLGKKIREIAEFLEVSKSTVGYILKKYKDRKTLERPPHSGRRMALNATDINLILSEVKNEPKISSEKLARVLAKKTNKEVSSRTVRRYLDRNGYNARYMCKKPLLSKKNEKSRFEMSKMWIYWQQKNGIPLFFLMNANLMFLDQMGGLKSGEKVELDMRKKI